MKINSETLLSIKSLIEENYKLDPSLTDVIINYQLKEADKVKNFLNIQIKLK